MRTFRRLLFWWVLFVGGLLCTLLLWAHSEGSLGQALRLGAAWLPQGMQLSFKDAKGNLFKGQVAQWRWQQDQLEVQGQTLQWTLNTNALWHGEIDVTELSLQSLTLHDSRPTTPTQPWTQLHVPMPVQVRLRVGQLSWTGSVPWQAQDLDARYSYNHLHHQLNIQQLQWAQGHYQGELQLQASAPMALQAKLQAQLTSPGNTPLQLQAQAQGQMAGVQAWVQVNAKLNTEAQGANAPQLQIDAQLRPWQDLTQQHAQAHWKSLNLSQWWPQAPHALLEGTLDMRASSTPANAAPTWHFDLNTRIGQGQLAAQVRPAGTGWQGHVQLRQVRSADLYPAVPATLWSGRTTFQTQGKTTAFTADLQGQEPAGTPAFVRSQGQWTDQALRLNTLDIRWAGLTAQGQVQAQMSPQRIQGELNVQWPGMQAQWQGDLQAERGQGTLNLNISQAPAHARWLAQWPALPNLPWRALTQARTQVQWLRGWNHPQARVQAQWTHKGWPGLLQLSAQTDLGAQRAQTQLMLEQLRLSSPEHQSWNTQLAQPMLLQHQRVRGLWTTRWSSNELRTLGPAGHTARLVLTEGQWGGGTHQLRIQAQDWPLAWAQTLLGTPDLNDVPVLTQAEVSVQEQDIRAQLRWNSPLAGSLQAQVQTTATLQTGQWQWSPQAPWRGEIRADLPEMDAWSRLAPPGWRVRGHLSGHITLSGSLAQPHWQGEARGENMAIRSAVNGVEFHDGRFTAQLQGQRIDLQSFSIAGAGEHGGVLRGQGQIVWPTGDDRTPWNAADALVQLKLVAEQLRVTNRADRRLVISGEVDTRVAQRQLLLRGRVRADQALFVLPEDTTPTLGQDVHVQGRGQTTSSNTASAGSWLSTPDVQVTLDPGDDFYVMGQGVTTRLTGQLQVSSNAQTQGQPRLQGELQTVGGLYKAYGQNLAIEQGALTFSGAYDNPKLNIVALRANITERVGVRVTGTALNPAIRLYADPDMPDADKLAWLVLGRSAANGGAESVVLQQAALSLLGGKNTLGSEVAQALGLDEVSLAQGSRTDTSATGTALTLGKRLSKDFYMAYESSLNGTFGSLFVFYDLSRLWTLRAQAGDQNTLDLIYTIRKR